MSKTPLPQYRVDRICSRTGVSETTVSRAFFAPWELSDSAFESVHKHLLKEIADYSAELREERLEKRRAMGLPTSTAKAVDARDELGEEIRPILAEMRRLAANGVEETPHELLVRLRAAVARHLRDRAPADVEVDDHGRTLKRLDKSDLGRRTTKRKRSLSPRQAEDVLSGSDVGETLRRIRRGGR